MLIEAAWHHSSHSLTADTHTSVLPQFEEAQAEAPLALVPRKSPARRDAPQKPEETPGVPSEDSGDVPTSVQLSARASMGLVCGLGELVGEGGDGVLDVGVRDFDESVGVQGENRVRKVNRPSTSSEQQPSGRRSAKSRVARPSAGPATRLRGGQAPWLRSGPYGMAALGGLSQDLPQVLADAGNASRSSDVRRWVGAGPVQY
ncbi:hypothetical protein ACFY2M_28450 [Streptomyces sp. NPDC001276]|uniref:hypothetical protein n=1 Tax=Streptomyces sp. NPDC001276 TaxID=3364555 RepID=UPI0036BE8EAE